jgi:hypothetical protein
MKLMQDLLTEIEEIAPKVNDWKQMDQREGWTIYAGTSGEWRLLAALSGDGKHGDGTGTKGMTIIRFTPKLAIEVAKMAAEHDVKPPQEFIDYVMEKTK